jgi:uncharacterized protein YsxB (DUF464 family)
MIKVEVSKDCISISGHANFDDYGKDIVCAAVSSVVLTTINGILLIDNKSITVEQNDKLTIKVNYHNDTIDKLIENMLRCLKEIEKNYEKNIKIKEE